MSDKTTAETTVPAEKEKNVSLQFRLPESLHKVLDDHAWDTRQRLHQVMLTAAREYAEKHGLI